MVKKFLWHSILLAMLVCPVQTIHGQPEVKQVRVQAEELLDARGEAIIRFCLPPGYDVHFFSSLLSVDRVIGDTIEAYVNQSQYNAFLQLDIPYTLVPPPSLHMHSPEGDLKSAAAEEDPYPSYEEYLGMMEGFARDHPELCSLVEIGRSVKGRKLLALKISDNPKITEPEPVFLYTSTMHGDELAGYMLLLKLARELLDGYGSDNLVTGLVDDIEIWINPLANPDGTYFLSDSSVFGATRFNANHVDLNRNFPGLPAEDHPDGEEWQAETLVMMNWMKGLNVVLAANLHCGMEVVNYPWDTWSRLHPDDAWYRHISRAYADTVHNYSRPTYMTFLDNGITNGYAWYYITGGRQDYTNYYLYGREVTLEISDEKYPLADQLEELWYYNRKSLLEFMGQVLYGVRGQVTDSVSGRALKASLTLDGYDTDNSHVFSSPADGRYCRLLLPGSYNMIARSPGYADKKVSITLGDKEQLIVDLRLSPLMTGNLVYPNPFTDHLYFFPSEGPGELRLDIYDLNGRRLQSVVMEVDAGGPGEIPAGFLRDGTYLCVFTYRGQVFREILTRIRP